METITFDTYSCMLTDEYNENENYDEEIRLFTVQKDWATNWIAKNCEMTFEEFMNEYTWDDTDAMYTRALCDGVIIEERIEERDF